MPKLIDIHCHVDERGFANDWKEVIQKTLDQDIWLVNIGADLETSRHSVKTTGIFPEGVFASVGIHPTHEDNISEADWEEIKLLAKNEKVVTIGECGLEYFQSITNYELRVTNEERDRITNERKEEQKKLFRKHIELAIEVDKPLMVHCRPSKGSQDAYLDAIEMLLEYKKEYGERVRANFHFFAGNLETAKKCIELGFTLSFTGVITFANQYDEVIKWLPADRIVAETDAPFVAPIPFRSKRCEPAYVEYVVRKMAELRGISYEEMAVLTVENARKFFRL